MAAAKRPRLETGAPDTPVSDAAPGPSPQDWQLAFSKTRKRFYYFHPATNRSFFEPPGEMDRCTNALADLAATCNAHMSTDPGQPATTPAEYLRWLKQMTRHPHPQHEILRAEALERLRSYYETICRERLRWTLPPRESFNHWVWQMQAQAAAHGREGRNALRDPVLPVAPDSADGAAAPAGATESAVSPLRRQLMESLPANLRQYKFLKSSDRLVKNLQAHAESSLYLSETYGRGPSADEDLAIVRAAVADVMDWLNHIARPASADVLDKLERFRQKSIDAVKRLLDQEVDDICKAMDNAAASEAHALAEQTRSKQPDGAPAATFDPPLGFADLTVRLEGAVVQVAYLHNAIPLQHRHWDKLCALYGRQHADQELLLPRLWCMLRRYQTVFGSRDNGGRVSEGGGFQAAIPVPLFRALQESLGVGLECFASPLNCYLPTYCSAFADTDRFFGSLGSFFHLELTEGSCEANPPFNEEVMAAMANRIEELLSRPTAGPLSFAVIVPEWVDPPTPALETMKGSRFLRADFVVPAMKHRYRIGLQHLYDEASEPFDAVHDSHLFILQNDLGAERWPATPAVLQRLLDAWTGGGEGGDAGASAADAKNPAGDGRVTPVDHA